MNSETYFIRNISSTSHTIGDDGAQKEDWIYSKDAFFENVHFKRRWMSAYQIAQKAMMVNISDAVAMNAAPQYALLAVAAPSDMRAYELKQLSQGFLDTAARYGIEIIGGDTIANSKLDISVTLISRSTQTLWRHGIKHGDWIAYTGKLGTAKRHLHYLLSGATLHAKSRFHTLHVRDTFVRKSRRALRAGMDISDGLFSDMEKLSQRNGLGFRFEQKIAKRVGCSGEEYEMLFACSARKRRAVMRRAAKTRTPITFVAKAVRGRFTNRCKRHHF